MKYKSIFLLSTKSFVNTMAHKNHIIPVAETILFDTYILSTDIYHSIIIKSLANTMIHQNHIILVKI